MAVVAYLFGSLASLLAAVLAYALTDIGLAGAFLIYLFGGIGLGSLILIVRVVAGLFRIRSEPEAQTSF